MKLYLVLMFVLLLVGSVLAGEKIYLNVDLEEIVLVPVSEKDMIEFYLGDHRHGIIIDKENENSLDLDIFLFLDGKQTVSYVSVFNDSIAKIDINKDGKGDLYLGYSGHYANKSLLLVKNPKSERILGDITGSVVADDVENEDNGSNLYIISVILGVIIILVCVLIYINIKNKSD
ncbi:MAG: hypothetical protein AABW46_00060 [Nanoarchaeota archaeon]